MHKNWLVALCLLWQSAPLSSSAQGLPGGDDPQYEELVLQGLLSDQTLAGESWVGLKSSQDERLYLSWNEWKDALGFYSAVKVQTKDTKKPRVDVGTRGFDQAPYALDPARQILTWNGREYSAGQRDLLIRDDQVYFSTAWLSQVFGVEIKFDPFNSQIRLKVPWKTPGQEKNERDNSLVSRGTTNTKNIPVLDVQSPTISAPRTDWTVSYPTGGEWTSNTQIGMQAYDFDQQGNIDLGNRGVRNIRWTSSRWFNEPALKKVEIFSVSNPRINSLVQSSIQPGVSISNYPQHRSVQFSTREFKGYLPEGWEVELYLSDILIDRKFSEQGQYLFQAIPVYYGSNLYRLRFYGPQGQRREETYPVYLGPQLIQPTDLFYQATLGLPGTSRPLVQLQMEKGLTKRTTLQSAIAHQDGEYYFSSGLVHFFDSWFVGSQVLMSQGKYWGSESQFQKAFNGFNLGGRLLWTEDRFRSQVVNIDGQAPQDREGSVDVSIPQIATFLLSNQLRLTSRHLLSPNRTNSVIDHRFSFLTGKILWSHAAQMSWNPSAVYEGDLSANFQFAQFSSRTGLVYYPRIGKISQELVLRSFSRFQPGFRYQYLLSERNWDGQIFSNFVTPRGLISFNLQRTVGRELQALAQYSFGLGYSTQVPGWMWMPQGLSGTALLKVRAFIDQNRNGRWDPDEKALAGVFFRVGDVKEAQTLASGEAFFPTLPSYSDLALISDLTGIQDPYLFPVEEKYSLRMRPAQDGTVQFAFQYYGEVDGMLTKKTKTRVAPAFRVEVRMEAVGSEWSRVTRTDSEGYYYFGRVPPGKYLISIPGHPEFEKSLEIPPTGAARSLENFNLANL